MKYYNAIVYWNYDSVTTYHNVTDLQRFIDHFSVSGELSSIVKVFFYRKARRADATGRYCGYWFPSTGIRLKS